MVDISQIFLSSSRLTIDKRSLDSESIPVFKENEIIEAKVLKVFSGRSAQLLISGRSVTVKTHMPLSEGDTITLRAESSGEASVLKLISKEDPVQELNKALADTMDRAGPYKNLQKLFDLLKMASKLEEGPSPKGVGARSGAGGEKSVELMGSRMLETQKSAILDRLPVDERLLLERFVNVKSVSFQDKLTALLTSSEGKKIIEKFQEPEGLVKKGPEQPLPPVLDQKKNMPDIQQALLTPGKKILVDTILTAPKASKADILKTPASQVNPSEHSEQKIVDEFVHEARIQWTDKLVTLLAANKEAFFSRPPLNRDAERLFETLLHAPSGSGKKSDIEINSLILNSKGEQALSLSMKAPSVLTAVRLMADLVKTMSLKSDSPDVQMVKGFIKNSGLSWENKLLDLVTAESKLTFRKAEEMTQSDLKGLGLSILGMANEKEGEALSLVRNFIDTLEHLQLINQNSAESFGKYLIPFPAMFNEQMTFGQLLIDLGKDTDKNKPLTERVVKVAFILELSNLGDLRADFSIYKKSVTGVFGVGNRGLSQMMKKEIPSLEKRLKALGYKVYGIDCTVVAAEALSTATLTDQLVSHETDRVLNLVI